MKTVFEKVVVLAPGIPGTQIEITKSAQINRICCTCAAKVKVGGKEEKRFLRRHPRLCTERKEFNQQLAKGTRSVETLGPLDVVELEEVVMRQQV